MFIRRCKVFGHRIQDGKAIIDMKLYDSRKLIPPIHPITWVGDAYELRDELNLVIEELERKHRNKQ